MASRPDLPEETDTRRRRVDAVVVAVLSAACLLAATRPAFGASRDAAVTVTMTAELFPADGGRSVVVEADGDAATCFAQAWAASRRGAVHVTLEDMASGDRHDLNLAQFPRGTLYLSTDETDGPCRTDRVSFRASGLTRKIHH